MGGAVRHRHFIITIFRRLVHARDVFAKVTMFYWVLMTGTSWTVPARTFSIINNDVPLDADVKDILGGSVKGVVIQ